MSRAEGEKAADLAFIKMLAKYDNIVAKFYRRKSTAA